MLHYLYTVALHTWRARIIQGEGGPWSGRAVEMVDILYHFRIAVLVKIVTVGPTIDYMLSSVRQQGDTHLRSG